MNRDDMAPARNNDDLLAYATAEHLASRSKRALMKPEISTLRFLICHDSGSGLAHMRQVVSATFPSARILCSSNLTQAYDALEHQQPDVFLVAQELASVSEFDLIVALLNILGIGCVFWAPSSAGFTRRPRCSFVPFDPEGPAETLVDAVTKALSKQSRASPSSPAQTPAEHFDPRHVLLIGASTGGVDALAKTLGHFSRGSPPTVIVQHTGGQFARSLIRLLDSVTDAVVQPAVDGASLAAGHVYLAPGDEDHLILSGRGDLRLALRKGDPVAGHRPSIDVMFRSAVGHGRFVSAALLTGMGQDGARGLLALRSAGAHTIAQDQATSVVYGMPRIAAEMGAATEVLALDRIGPALLRRAQYRARV